MRIYVKVKNASELESNICADANLGVPECRHTRVLCPMTDPEFKKHKTTQCKVTGRPVANKILHRKYRRYYLYLHILLSATSKDSEEHPPKCSNMPTT